MPTKPGNEIALSPFFDHNNCMNQTTHELMYILDVKANDQSPRKIVVHDHLLAGLDPRNDLVLVDPKIGPKHFLFKTKDGLLTLQFLGAEHTTFLNTLPLESGKMYVVERGDTLKCGRVEICIHQDLLAIRPPSEIRANPLQRELPNALNLKAVGESAARPVTSEERKTNITEMKTTTSAPEKTTGKKNAASALSSTFPKVLLMIYGFIFDVTATYFVLTSLLPFTGFLSLAQSLLYPLTDFFNQTLIPDHPEYASYKVLSSLEFLVAFHLVMISCSLLLGNTPGAFLLGLKPVKKSFLGNRFKAYVYSLLNIALLPLILFDIPLFRGNTIKEALSFFKRVPSSSLLFRVTRTTVAPSLIVFFLLSPLFLKFPYSAVIVEEKPLSPKYKETHIRYVNSLSSTLGSELHGELNSQYSLVPFFKPGKIGMALFEHVTGQTLIAEETSRLKTQEALFKLRFGSPLSSLYLPNELLSNERLKTLAFKSLMISPLHFKQALLDFGPFFANGLLFKQDFVSLFDRPDSLLAIPFSEKNPFLLLSSSSEYALFWFTPKEIISMKITVPKQTKLLEHFTRDILAGMRFTQAYSDKLKSPEILETLDAFERRNHQTLLTYYIYEAKNHSKKDPAWRSFLKKNILQTKLALNGTTNKNIEKSFDEILKSIE